MQIDNCLKKVLLPTSEEPTNDTIPYSGKSGSTKVGILL